MKDLGIDRKWRKYFGLFTCKQDKFSEFLFIFTEPHISMNIYKL